MRTLPKLAAICLISGPFVVGCSTTLELPNDGPTTMEVYQNHVGGHRPMGVPDKEDSEKEDKSSSNFEHEATGDHRKYLIQVDSENPDRKVEVYRVNRTIVEAQSDFPEFSRVNLKGEINTKFPKLPNPEFTMYVYPHLTKRGGLPIPFYATEWNLYEKDHYAKPGEVVKKRKAKYQHTNLITDSSELQWAQ